MQINDLPEFDVERAMGIEPTALAWEARVLPLYDARFGRRDCTHRRGRGQPGGRGKLAGMTTPTPDSVLSLTINGEARSVAGPASVAALLDEMGLTGKRLAVERNGEIVPKGLHASTPLADGDRLEIVVAVGGG